MKPRNRCGDWLSPSAYYVDARNAGGTFRRHW